MTFVVGQQFEHGGLFYRIRSGNRCEGDLVIEFSQNGRDWHRPAIAHSQILLNFKFQVEENNYGPNGKVQSGRGGYYLLDSIKRAMINGWESEAKRIADEREKREQKNTALLGQLSLPV